MLTVKKLREQSGMTQEKFGEYFGIPKRTIQNWESTAPESKRKCPEYLLKLMEYKLTNEGLIRADMERGGEDGEEKGRNKNPEVL